LNHQKGPLGLAAVPFAAVPLAARFAAMPFAAILLSTALGCTLDDVSSDAIRTNGVFAEMLAISPGKGSTLVRVNLTVGGASGTRVELTGDDALVAEAGDDSVTLARTGRGRYEEVLPGESSREVTVRFERGPEDATAQGSVLLPEPYALRTETDVAGGLNRSTPLIVTWDPPGAEGDTVEWSVDGDCVWSDTGITPDDGVMTVQPEHVRVRPSQVGEDCSVRVTLDRSVKTDVDPQFVPGSSLRAIQRRAVDFTSTPAAGEKNGPALTAAAMP
jgi:hypothetical protein